MERWCRWCKVVKSAPAKLLRQDNYQRVALVDRLPFCDLDFFDRSGNGGSEVVFHFHGFENSDGLAEACRRYCVG